MTRRERAEARIERRREWAEGRREKAAQGFAQARKMGSVIPFGQPVHGQRDRNYRERIGSTMDRACESSQMADHHDQKAAGIERQLETTIFSDDADAVEAIRAKVAKGRAQLERMKAANKIVRKFAGKDEEAGKNALIAAGYQPGTAARLFEPDYGGRLGYPSYELTNLGANMRRLEGRIVEIERQAARTLEAKASPGGVTIKTGPDGLGGTWARVTFAEKPEREVLDALRAAGYRWGDGSWIGDRAKLPASVLALCPAPTDGLTPGEKLETIAERAAGMAETFGPLLTLTGETVEEKAAAEGKGG